MMSSHLIYNLTRQATKTSARTLRYPPCHTTHVFSLTSSSRWLSSEEATTITTTTSDEVKTGKIKFFDISRGYGFINTDDMPQDIFLHAGEVKKVDLPEESFSVRLKPGMRVQFKIGHDDEGKVRAHSVTLEGGKLIRPYGDNYMEIFERSRKSEFGQEVFDIMNSVTEQSEMESNIVKAFEDVKGAIEKHKEKVEKIIAAYDAEESN